MAVFFYKKQGSGKTFALLLGILSKIDYHSDRIQAVILVARREECLAIANTLNRFSRRIPTSKALAIMGGTSITSSIRSVQETHPQILVSTPGRLLELANRQYADLSTTSMLLIEQADQIFGDPSMEAMLIDIMPFLPHDVRIITCSCSNNPPAEISNPALSRNYNNRIVIHV